ncbi:MAG: amidohydrolase [Dehalococcoidales bacterium]|nr:amidohydrolase [Dehalococcoidales bacterium]
MENGTSKKMRVIALEEHYATRDFLEATGTRAAGQKEPGRSLPGPTLLERLCDIGDLRAGEMDAAGVDMQVLSLTTPGLQQMDAAEAAAIAREQNDYLAERVNYYPERFAAFAALPTSAPEEAARELERTVSQYGFKGAVVMGHTRGRYLDDEFFRPVLECASTLQVPLYIHPAISPSQVVEAWYSGNHPPNVTKLLSTTAWGWHIETAVHCLRLVTGGVFDRFPALQVITGHLGEALPFMLPRIDERLAKEETSLERTMGEYFRENFYYTFSGFNYLPAFLDLLFQVGVSRILFSADYPYASMEAARAFLDGLPLSPVDRGRIAHENAERLLLL